MADLVKLVDEFVGYWSTHDRDKAEAAVADNVVFQDVLSGGDPVKGRAAYRKEVIDGFMDPVPDCEWKRITERAPVVGADSIAFEWTFSGTNTGAWPDGTEATNKPFDIHGATFFRFDAAGKIAEYMDYIDYATLSKQLGWT